MYIHCARIFDPILRVEVYGLAEFLCAGHYNPKWRLPYKQLFLHIKKMRSNEKTHPANCIDFTFIEVFFYGLSISNKIETEIIFFSSILQFPFIWPSNDSKYIFFRANTFFKAFAKIQIDGENEFKISKQREKKTWFSDRIVFDAWIIYCPTV